MSIQVEYSPHEPENRPHLEVQTGGAGEVRYGGFWRRFAASFIDGILLIIVEAIINTIAAVILITPFRGIATASISAVFTLFYYLIRVIINLLISWLYFAALESSPKQATLGKMALGLIVTDADYQRLSFWRATGRYFAKIISSLTLFIGYILAGFTEKKQALHDFIAGTYVIYKGYGDK